MLAMYLQSSAMPVNDQFSRYRPELNSLTFTQSQVNFILGHSLASIFQDVLRQPLPENLLTLAQRLDRKRPPAPGTKSLS